MWETFQILYLVLIVLFIGTGDLWHLAWSLGDNIVNMDMTFNNKFFSVV